MGNLSDVVWGTFVAYKECAREATSSLARSWIIIPAAVGAYLAFTFALSIVAPLSQTPGIGIVMGFVLGFVQIALLSLYYGWLMKSRERQGLKLRELFEFDWALFMQVISIAFMVFIAEYLVGTLVAGMEGAHILPLFLRLGMVIVFNAVPEVVMIHRMESLSALSHAAQFTRDNWIEWFLPFVLLLLPVITLSTGGAVYLMAESEVLLPPLTVVTGWAPMIEEQTWKSNSALVGWGLTILSLVVANWYMLFRAALFQELESGTRRNRAFRARS